MKSTQPIGNRQSKIVNGFTLVEVMLVVVIILVAIGIGVPTLSGTSDATRMKDAVRSTIRTARYARSMAILNQADCTLTFPTNRIVLTGPEGNLVERRIAETIQVEEFENLAEEDADSRKVVFSSSGMNDGFKLTLTDEDGRRHTITCNPITGKVEVDEE